MSKPPKTRLTPCVTDITYVEPRWNIVTSEECVGLQGQQIKRECSKNQEHTDAVVMKVLCYVVTYRLRVRDEKSVSRAGLIEGQRTRGAGADHGHLFPFVIPGLRVIASVHDRAFEFFLKKHPNI